MAHSDSFGVGIEGLVDDRLTMMTAGTASTAAISSHTMVDEVSNSFFGRVNYAYANKYLVELLVRSDASTKFAPENYWGYFPSASLGWIASEEEWMKDIKWIDYLKLRGSFGLTGRDNITAWQWMQVYKVESDKGAVVGPNGNAGIHITIPNGNASVNRDVRWDKSYKANIGLDFNTLNNRLAFNVDAYYVWDRDILLPFSASVPGIVGTASAYQNYGKMNSYGIELSATWRDNIGKDFKYKVQINTGFNDNKVLLMDWDEDHAYMKVHKNSRTDMGTWGMQCLGMFRSYQDIEEYFEKYNITSYMGKTKDQIRPGMLIYKDIRGSELKADGTYGGPDGIVSGDHDRVQLSNRSNPYHFTTNLSAEWKGLSLTAQINASWGGYSFVPAAALNPNDGTNSGYKYLEYINMPSFWNPDNVFVYQEKYADLRAAFGDDLVSYYMHYITNGKAEGRTATGGASGSSGAAAPTTTTTTSTAGSGHPMFTDAQWAYANEVIALVNQQRAAYGLGPVTATYELSSAAQARAVETVTLFSHTRPNGSSCFSSFPTYGVSYRCAGENIAAGQDTPAEVVNAWMNSPGHRANILNGSFNHMGVGCYNANTIYGIYWTQMFTN